MQISHIFADSYSEMNSSQFRGVIFVDALNRAGHRANMVGVESWMKDTCREQLSNTDLIVVERILVEEAVERAGYWKAKGKAIVIDIDDSYSLLQPFEESGNQAAKFWQQGIVDVSYGNGISHSKKLSVSPLEQFRHGLKYCTGLTSPSRILNDDWKMYAPAWVLPNYLDSRRYLPSKNLKVKSSTDELVIGWGGSMSHRLSFLRSGVDIALRHILKKHKNVKFMLCGDKRILDIVKLPPEQIIFRNYVTYQEWPRSAKSFDIGLAPLQGRYDWSRSEIKAEEYSTLAIPFVGTGCPTYERFEQKNLGLYVQDSLEYDAATVEKRAVEWENKLEDIITHYADYKQKALYDSVNLAPYWWVDNRVGDIVKTYESIIAHG